MTSSVLKIAVGVGNSLSCQHIIITICLFGGRNTKLCLAKVFLSEGGYYGFHGINGNMNSNETVRDFSSSDGYDGFHGICGEMIN